MRQRRSRFSGGAVEVMVKGDEMWPSGGEDARPNWRGSSAATKSSGACSRLIYSKAALVCRCQVHRSNRLTLLVDG